MPIMIGSGDNTKLLLVSPSKNNQFNKRKFSASLEVHGTPQSSRVSGSGYGKVKIFENQPVRKTNLTQRKNEVLRIAAENFKLVRRLNRVQSAVSSRSQTPSRSARKYSSRPKSSIVSSYPNVTDPRNLKPRHMRRTSSTLVK